MSLETELAEVLNRHSMENGSNTPDFVLADFLVRSINAFNVGVNMRTQWHGRNDAPGHEIANPLRVMHTLANRYKQTGDVNNIAMIVRLLRATADEIESLLR